MSETPSGVTPTSPPDPEPRPPVAPPVQGTAPAVESPSDSQLAMEARARAALHAVPAPFAQPELPPASESELRPQRVTSTAIRIGSAVGVAEREIRHRLNLVRHPEKPIREQASEVAQRLEHELSATRRRTAERVDEFSDVASERLSQLREKTSSQFQSTRLRLQEIAEKYPLQTIAAIAGIGFVFGFTLRMRRNRG